MPIPGRTCGQPDVTGAGQQSAVWSERGTGQGNDLREGPLSF
jgi:hypothetical protein